MNNTYYHIQAKRYDKMRDEAVLFNTRYDAAECADSLDISTELDQQHQWLYVHKVKLLDDDLRIFKHMDSDDLIYIENLIDNMYYLKLGSWSWRLFQNNAIKQQLVKAGFDGYTCKIADYHCTILFNSSKLKWLKMNRYDYSELQDDQKRKY